MTVTISPAFLFSPESGQAEAAELWDAITEKQLADWEGEWLPELFKALQRLSRAGPRAGTGIGGGRQKHCKGCSQTPASALFAVVLRRG